MKLGISLAVSRLGNGGSGSAFSSSATFVTGGFGAFAGSTFIFTPTGHQVDDWMFVTADGISSPTITGGSGATWSTAIQYNVGGSPTYLLYRKLVAGDAGATFTVNNGLNSGPCHYTIWRGVASVNLLQSVITGASVTSISFSAPVLAPNSSRLLAIISCHDGSFVDNFSGPVNWTTRNAFNSYGPKYDGDILSSLNSGGPTFSQSSTQVKGIVGWLFELVGT